MKRAQSLWRLRERSDAGHPPAGRRSRGLADGRWGSGDGHQCVWWLVYRCHHRARRHPCGLLPHHSSCGRRTGGSPAGPAVRGHARLVGRCGEDRRQAPCRCGRSCWWCSRRAIPAELRAWSNSCLWRSARCRQRVGKQPCRESGRRTIDWIVRGWNGNSMSSSSGNPTVCAARGGGGVHGPADGIAIESWWDVSAQRPAYRGLDGRRLKSPLRRQSPPIRSDPPRARCSRRLALCAVQSQMNSSTSSASIRW